MVRPFWKKRRKKRYRVPRAPELTVKQILAWVDAYHDRTGEWPKATSGPIPETADDTWFRVDKALRNGTRNLPGGSSLAQLLDAARGVRNIGNLPPLTIQQILGWADAHHAQTKSWPHKDSGAIGTTGETWQNVDAALRLGLRSLQGYTSLAQLLDFHRQVPNVADRPFLSEKQIWRWAKQHHRRTGEWPTRNSGDIPDSGGETWLGIDTALHRGGRGFLSGGGDSLARLLARHGVRNRVAAPPLTEELILSWADAHHRRTGRWPRAKDGPVLDAPGETWGAVQMALKRGNRGLPGGTSLAEFLSEHRRIRNNWHLPRLTVEQILAWADAYYRRHGSWPTSGAGTVAEAPEETWKGLDAALRKGRRGLPGGSSLYRLLASRRND